MTLRGKLTVLFGKRANVYGEGEQDVRAADRRVAAVGTQFLISDRVKLYGRHEFISSLDGPYALTEGQRSYNTVFGVASSYMKDGDVFSEYRLADAISGREAEAAIGLRNQWTIAKGVRLHTGFERLHAIAGLEREATAASVGLEYLASARFKSTARLEWRNDSSSDSWLSTAGFAQKLSRNWTMLARNYYQLTVPEGSAEPGAGSLLDRRGLPGYDDEPPQPADALRVQSRRHVPPVGSAHPACRSAPQPIDACRWCRRTSTSIRCAHGHSRASTRRSSSTIEPRPARADSASTWSLAASALTSHNGGTA